MFGRIGRISAQTYCKNMSINLKALFRLFKAVCMQLCRVSLLFSFRGLNWLICVRIALTYPNMRPPGPGHSFLYFRPQLLQHIFLNAYNMPGY